MERWVGKVAVVTGASSGIGENTCVALVEHGLKVIGLARRIDRMNKLAKTLEGAKGKFYPLKCDVSQEQDIIAAFRFAETLGGVDILINNAGFFTPEYIIDCSSENMEKVLNVNVLAAAKCIRETVKSIREHKNQGHIINVSSVLGHNVEFARAPINLYAPSKFALRAMSDAVRNELSANKVKVKVTNLSPGLVRTEMPTNSTYGEKIFEMLPYLETKDIVDGIIYVLGTPPNVEISEITIQPLHGILQHD